MPNAAADGPIERLRRLFLEHPVWIGAAARLAPEATSTVFFSGQPGRAWHLENRTGEILLLPGAARDPDFVFRFTPASVEKLEAVDGGVDAFAIELFGLMLEEPLTAGVAFRIVASFPRLLRRGYLRLLLSAGPKVIALGAARGIRSLADLRRLIATSRSTEVADWEEGG